jgi:hypothetical protein
VTIKVISSWPRQLKLEDNGEMRRFDWSGYEGHVPELVAERDALRAIVDALPKCAESGCQAHAVAFGGGRPGYIIHPRHWCDAHRTFDDEALPWAEALRAYETSK